MRKQSEATKLRIAKTKIKNLEFSYRVIKEELRERRKWGQMMSNICFNLSQDESYKPMAREAMKDCRENWDKIPTSSL